MRGELERHDLCAAAALQVADARGGHVVGSPASASGAPTQVHLLAIQEEALVQRADPLEDLAADQETGTLRPVDRKRVEPHRRQGSGPVAPVDDVWHQTVQLQMAPGDRGQGEERIAGQDGLAGPVEQARRQDAPVRQPLQSVQQHVERAWLELRIRVEQEDRVTACHSQPLVDGGGETAIGLVRDDGGARPGRTDQRRGLRLGGVVDYHHLGRPATRHMERSQRLRQGASAQVRDDDC